MTSGNRSDDPIAHDDADAVARLGPLVDAFLTHDRPIHIRCDDSVVRATPRRVQVLRRSRGYAPEPLRLPGAASRAVLAVGGELKCTIAVTREHDVVAGHHIGDLEHLATYESFLQALEHLPALYGVSPEVVAHDLHPEYLSSKLARRPRRPHRRGAAPPRARRRVHGRARAARPGPRARPSTASGTAPTAPSGAASC